MSIQPDFIINHNINHNINRNRSRNNRSRNNSVDNNSGNQPPHHRRRRSWRGIEIILLLAFLLCLASGLAALYLLFQATQPPALRLNQQPLETLEAGEIVPALALRHLAGDSVTGLTQQALDAGELETAHALLLLNTTVNDIQRANQWLQLAEEWLKAENQNRDLNRRAIAAAQSVYMVQKIAVLSLEPPPMTRAQLLIQAAKLYALAQQYGAASVAATQALRIIAQTPDLLPAQRSQLFTFLQGIMNGPEGKGWQDEALRRQVTDYVRNPFLTPVGIVITPTLFSLADPLPMDEAVHTAETNRQQAARTLADRLLLMGREDVEPERQALAHALAIEDQVRQASDQQRVDSGISLQQQLYLLLAQQEWNAIKLRVALNGYGISVMPEWENQRELLRQALTERGHRLKAVLDALALTQSDPTRRAILQTEAILWETEAIELGIMPTASPEPVREQLRIAQNNLAQLLTQQGSDLALTVNHIPTSDTPGYQIQVK